MITARIEWITVVRLNSPTRAFVNFVLFSLWERLPTVQYNDSSSAQTPTEARHSLQLATNRAIFKLSSALKIRTAPF